MTSLFIQVAFNYERPSEQREKAYFSIINPDETGAGKQWSPKELDTENLRKSELALVIGEILPPSITPVLENATTSRSLRTFNVGRHTMIPTEPNAMIVVIRLSDVDKPPPPPLCVLCHKKDDICDAWPLPQAKRELPQATRDLIFFYHEWVTSSTCGPGITFGCNRGIARKFISQYLKDHEVPSHGAVESSNRAGENRDDDNNSGGQRARVNKRQRIESESSESETETDVDEEYGKGKGVKTSTMGGKRRKE
ncbi:hypothetical protein NPX13_g6069 [Xylaria arbuscula]|uniref:Uncharacterized protein n=1 Tax=Xylaria arbuscula TaxID=114810 RepID=A0A9W8ND86_9PEZI|nr:hypothetical protein NPX13_g6069 [Xylaria arbuscula]